jgi:tRNA(Ile)-lysidine synthase
MSKKNSSVILREEFKNFEDLSSIYATFKKKLNSLKKKTLLIAVSGGPDSLALSALAKAYSYNTKCKIHYVLINHNLRKNSTSEALSVKKLLKKNNINLMILKNKKLIKKNIQSQAREIRYDLLTNFCKKKKIKIILTAHNLEDQVETFFIRLSRGSGLQGLSSMTEINRINKNITLVRPLLDIKKIQLTKISKIIFKKYYKDPSNNDKKYLRTRIRDFRKTLEKSGINYDQIFKSIKNLGSSRDTLNLYFNKIYEEVTTIKNKQITISLKIFNNLNQEIKIKILSKAIKVISKSYYSTRSKKVVNLVDKIAKKNNVRLSLAGCLIIRQKKHIIIKKLKKS